MIVVGGLGSIPGALIGVALLGLLPEVMRTTMRGLLIWQELVYGLILILAVMFMPRGIWGFIAGRRGALMSAAVLAARRRRALRRPARAQSLLDGRGARRDPCADRPERRRQVDRVQLRVALLPPVRGRHPVRRRVAAARARARDRGARHRAHLPEHRAVPPHDRAGERADRHGAARARLFPVRAVAQARRARSARRSPRPTRCSSAPA